MVVENVTSSARYSILGINVSAVSYDSVVRSVVTAIEEQRPLAISALAVHGVMTGAQDAVHARRLNGIDILAPDGQPVRWALRWLHGVTLRDRVYGPELTVRLLASCEERDHSVFFFGSTEETLDALVEEVQRRFPDIRIAGAEPSRFMQLDEPEGEMLAARIRDSGANLVFVGLGCPRQETFVYEMRNTIGVPLLAVGAAFDFLAGTLPQAPRGLQDRGLEWAYRLFQEPRRLWKRYLVLNPLYLVGIATQRFGWRSFDPAEPDGTEPRMRFG